jgi:hypothetical protein
MIVLDSGGLSYLAGRDRRVELVISDLRSEGAWPPVVPSMVLIESLSGRPRNDVAVHRLLKICEIVEEVSIGLARRAATLRALAGRGSAVDALVVAFAEPGSAVLTGDVDDLSALAAHADDVVVRRV